MKKILLHHKTYLCIFIWVLLAMPQTFGAYRVVEVPQQLKIGNLKLIITKGARRQIQTRIYKLLRSSQNFSENLARLKSYAPLMEDILKEENLPTDFKYLPLLKSSLMANALNSHEGAGFWLLKEDLAKKVGLEVNDKVDERLNIIASTRGAARFLRKNNLYFKNWIYTILTLHMGLDNTKDFIKENYNQREIIGVQELYIEERTHSFIKKFLAYKIAFEEKMFLDTSVPLPLMPYQVSGKTLAQVARKFKVSVDLLKEYNLWLKKKRIPKNKVYDVVIPLDKKPKPVATSKIVINSIEPPPVTPHTQEQELKQDKRLEPEFHNRAKNKPMVVTPPLPQPKIVIQSIKDDRKRYPNIVDVVEKKPEKNESNNESTIINNIQVVSNREDENPLPKIKVKPSTTIQITEVRPQAVERPQYTNNTNNTTVEKTVERYDPVPPPVNNNDYNSSTDKFFPEGIKPRRNDQFISPNTPQSGIHVVAQGQTVFDVARRYDISVSDLRKWNYINNDVYAGQKLVVSPPKPTKATVENSTAVNERTFTPVQRNTPKFNRSRFVTTKTRTYVHVVIRGQSLTSIAEAYGVSVADIKDWNKLHSNVIHMGQKIVIFKVIRLLQHSSPITKGQFFREHKQTPLRDRLIHQQSKNLRKVMAQPYSPGE
ncbi:LysM peptidoglycan-binding domain-containing protein [uncultured Microscilla sp.]|uniref:LysM peptidoglycan-binding domain-containing protein n=1 Tax=uncultured Microscilla sp. TaxID=432653 RepID=UPI00261B68C2|nr:LysM peptidoglycan-binding domain-containing protein [uncultured Microscilla sp.]